MKQCALDVAAARLIGSTTSFGVLNVTLTSGIREAMTQGPATRMGVHAIGGAVTRTVIGAGAISAPFTDLTRQYVPVERVEYSDGLVAITYHRRIEGLDRWRVLVWDSTLGYRHGFLWSEQIRGQAIRRYREGKRADHTQCRLMLRGS